jgi:hypothetical protein
LWPKKKYFFNVFEDEKGGVDMCKKLIILCVVFGLSVPASALYIGEPSGCANPLYVDLQNGAPTKCNWQGWDFGWNWTGPVSKEFNNPLASDPWEFPVAELDTVRAGILPNGGGSRNRSGGFAFVPGTGEYGDPATGGKGLGTSYLKLTLTQLAPETEYLFKLWSYEAANVWVVNSDNPNRKYGCWSTCNPLQTMIEHGDPCGYAPLDPICHRGGSGMPDYLRPCVFGCDAPGGRTFMEAPVGDDNDYLGGAAYCVAFYATTNTVGSITIYGWIDPTDLGGSMHMPLNGFEVIPEPATVALLGLGGLALLRRKRT